MFYDDFFVTVIQDNVQFTSLVLNRLFISPLTCYVGKKTSQMISILKIEKRNITICLSGSGLQRVRANLYGALLYYLQIAQKPTRNHTVDTGEATGWVFLFYLVICTVGKVFSEISPYTI